MIRVESNQITANLQSLFDPTDPASLRCFAVLAGDLAGDILTDHPTHPTWGIVRQAGSDTTFLGGALNTTTIHQAITDLRRTGNVVIGGWPQDARWHQMPSNSDDDSFNIEFFDRPVGQRLDPGLRELSPECHLRHIDPAIFTRCHWHKAICQQYGGSDRFFEKGLGFCLMQHENILCEVYVAPAALGWRETGVRTHEAHRNQGYAALTCAHAIRTCEKLGHPTYWNTAKQNLASVAVARKMGDRTEREYRVLIWRKWS